MDPTFYYILLSSISHRSENKRQNRIAVAEIFLDLFILLNVFSLPRNSVSMVFLIYDPKSAQIAFSSFEAEITELFSTESFLLRNPETEDVFFCCTDIPCGVIGFWFLPHRQ